MSDIGSQRELESWKEMVGSSVMRATKISFLAFCGVLACALGLLTMWPGDRDADRSEIDALVARVAAESAVVTNDYLARAEISARLVAGSLSAMPDVDSQTLLFANVIDQSPQIDAVFVGESNGDFHFVARWIDPDAEPSDDAAAALRSREIRETADGRQTTERWFDFELTELAPPIVRPADYDPRERPWFIGAATSEISENWSDPYVFFSSQEVGITYSVAVTDRNGDDTVIGADIVLGDLIAFLEQRLPTPGSLALVLDRSGSVLATSDLSAQSSDTAAVDPRILDAALAPRPDDASASEPVLVHLDSGDTSEGEAMIAAVAPVGALDKWSLVVIAPEGELVVMAPTRSWLMTALLPAVAIAALLGLFVLSASYIFRLRRAVRTDALTGLISRYEIVRTLTGPLSRGQSSGALAIIDLNGFKSINDEHGHGIGDFVLRETARRIDANLPRAASVGRLGGDEFIVVFALDSNPIDRLKAVLTVLAEPITVGRRVITTGGSAGVTFFNEGEPTQLRRVLREADLALYAAKSDRENAVRIFHRSMEEPNLEHPLTPDELVDLST